MRAIMTKWVAVGVLALAAAPLAAQMQETITVDAQAPTRPFPHYWERMFGSGRAILSLRESWRSDLRAVRAATGASYIRFHGIFLDEVGLYTEGPKGEPVYNFSYVDQIYDGMLANGVRPFVELSFMPRALASKDLRQSFFYRPVVAPPKDWGRWDAMISAFARHLVQRYGLEEVSQWYFEVWNEPNLDFWAGEPRQASYWMLYDHTARALKSVSPRLRVGGPATAQAAWVSAFLQHCKQNNVPVDFVTTHVYGDDTAKDVFGTGEHIARNHMVCRAVQKVSAEIKASPLPQLPLIWSEFNASWSNHVNVTDSPYMGPWLGETVRQCDGLTQDMAYWSFSDVFEEQGVVKTPFYGGFGLMAAGGIPKPAYNAFALLHKLGEQRFVNDPEGTLLTRRSDGSLALALWNYADVDASVPPRKLTVKLAHFAAHSAQLQWMDPVRSNSLAAFEKMGSPPNPTQAQLTQLRAAAALLAPETRAIGADGTLSLEIPSQGLMLVTIAGKAAK